MAAQDQLFKLEQLQRTQNLIHDLNFQKAATLPKAAGAENQLTTAHTTTSFLIERTKNSVGKHDMSLIREHLKVFSELDPANPYYSTLLERINHGEHLSWKEFEDAVNRFSSNEYYMVKLQDEINNVKINAQLQSGQTETPVSESPPADQISPEVTNQPTEPSPPSDKPAPPSTPPAPAESSHLPPKPTSPPPQRPMAFTKQGAEKLQKVKESFQATKPQLKTPTPQLTQTATRLNSRLNAANRVMRVRPTNVIPISSRNRRKKPLLPKLAPRAAGAAALAGGGGAAASGGLLSNLLGARSALQIAKSTIGRIFPNLGRLIGNLMPEKLIAQGIRGLWNVGSSLGRAAFDGLFRNAFTAAPRALGAFGGGGGVGTFLSTAAGATAAVVTSAAFWWIVGISGIFIFAWWYNNLLSNSQCEKPGEMKVEKRLANTRSGQDEVQNGQQIDFYIQTTYIWLCEEKMISNITVTDVIPQGTEYVPDTAEAEVSGTGQKSTGTYDPNTKTLTWSVSNIRSNQPVGFYFSVQPNADTVDTWITNEATVRYTAPSGSGGGDPGYSGGTVNITGPSRGLMCVPGLDERLARIFEEAGISANVSPALLYAIAKAENGGSVTPHSLDGKLHPISPCGAHGLMQIQHPNDGSGKNYGPSCAAIGGTPNPPEVFDGLKARYNDASGGNIVDADSDKDSIFGAAFYVKERSQPDGKGYIDQLTEAELRRISRDYLGETNGPYANQYVNSYNDAFARQGTCGGGIGAGGVTQPVGGGVNAE